MREVCLLSMIEGNCVILGKYKGGLERKDLGVLMGVFPEGGEQ